MRLGLGSVEVFAQDREQRRRGLGDYSRENYLAGPGGIQQSVDLVVKKIVASYNNALADPQGKLRGWVGQVLLACGKPPGARERAQCLLEALRKQTVYVPDPENTEYVQTAEATLCLAPGHCSPGGDCDDLTVALATAYLIAGFPTMLIKQEFVGGGQQHILVAVEDETGNWLAADAGGNPYTNTPVGQRPNAMNETWIDPLAGVAPVIVGVGAAPESSTSGAATASQPWRYEKKHGKVWASRDGYSWLEVPGSGLGADPTPTAITAPSFAQATADLASQVTAVIGAGDTYLTAAPPEYTNAIQSYQAAGAAGATSVGPEIDLSGAANVTQPITQQAWVLNGALATISATSGTLVAAQQAQSLVKQMQSLYQRALVEGAAALARSPNAPPPPRDQGWSFGAVALTTIAAGATAGALFVLWQNRKIARRHYR